MEQKITRIPSSIIDQPWVSYPPAVCLYTWLSLMADKDGVVNTSINDLSERSGLSFQQVREALKRLLATKFITRLSTMLPTRYASQITVLYLATYKDANIVGNKATNNVTNNVTNKVEGIPRAYKNDILLNHSMKTGEEKEKEEKKKKDAANAATTQRKGTFYESLVPYVGRYGQGTVRRFFDYWSETNKSGTKMRFELQPTWETGRRLAVWASREKQFNSDGNGDDSRDNPKSRAQDAAGIIARLAAKEQRDNDGLRKP